MWQSCSAQRAQLPYSARHDECGEENYREEDEEYAKPSDGV
jgi:hypothetical protein